MRVLMKKIAGTISRDVSYTNLYHALKTIGFPLSKDTIIDYSSYANQSFLLFALKTTMLHSSTRKANQNSIFPTTAS